MKLSGILQLNLMNQLMIYFRHPAFEISYGEGKPQYVVNDIAVVKVDDTSAPMSLLRLACLPTSDPLPDQAVHAGWSSPPPLRKALKIYIICTSPFTICRRKYFIIETLFS